MRLCTDHDPGSLYCRERPCLYLSCSSGPFGVGCRIDFAFGCDCEVDNGAVLRRRCGCCDYYSGSDCRGYYCPAGYYYYVGGGTAVAVGSGSGPGDKRSSVAALGCTEHRVHRFEIRGKGISRVWNGRRENLDDVACRSESLLRDAESPWKEKGNSGACPRFESHGDAYQGYVLLIVGLRRARSSYRLSTSFSRSFQCPGGFPWVEYPTDGGAEYWLSHSTLLRGC